MLDRAARRDAEADRGAVVILAADDARLVEARGVARHHLRIAAEAAAAQHDAGHGAEVQRLAEMAHADAGHAVADPSPAR